MHPIAKEAYSFFAKQSVYLFIIDVILFLFFVVRGFNSFTDLAVASVLLMVNMLYIVVAVLFFAYQLVKRQQFHRTILPIIIAQFLVGYLYIWFFTFVASTITKMLGS